jgi:hypothetical protein
MDVLSVRNYFFPFPTPADAANNRQFREYSKMSATSVRVGKRNDD